MRWTVLPEAIDDPEYDGQRRYTASWAEREVPGRRGKSRTWGPRTLEQAKAMLTGELRRTLSAWPGRDGEPARYRQALAALEAARGPVTIDLPGHVLTLTEAPGEDSGLAE